MADMEAKIIQAGPQAVPPRGVRGMLAGLQRRVARVMDPSLPPEHGRIQPIRAMEELGTPFMDVKVASGPSTVGNVSPEIAPSALPTAPSEAAIVPLPAEPLPAFRSLTEEIPPAVEVSPAKVMPAKAPPRTMGNRKPVVSGDALAAERAAALKAEQLRLTTEARLYHQAGQQRVRPKVNCAWPTLRTLSLWTLNFMQHSGRFSKGLSK